MKFFLIIICLYTFISNVYAESNYINTKKMPEGIFKKSITGKIIQYDKNGKKIGLYKIENGRYQKIK